MAEGPASPRRGGGTREGARGLEGPQVFAGVLRGELEAGDLRGGGDERLDRAHGRPRRAGAGGGGRQWRRGRGRRGGGMDRGRPRGARRRGGRPDLVAGE